MKVNPYSPAFTGIKGYAVKDRSKPEEKIKFNLQGDKVHIDLFQEGDKVNVGYISQYVGQGQIKRTIPGIAEGELFDEVQIDSVNRDSFLRLYKTASVNVGKVTKAGIGIFHAKTHVNQMSKGSGLIFMAEGEVNVDKMEGHVLSNATDNFFVSSDTPQKIHVREFRKKKTDEYGLEPSSPINIKNINGMSREVVGESLRIYV